MWFIAGWVLLGYEALLVDILVFQCYHETVVQDHQIEKAKLLLAAH